MECSVKGDKHGDAKTKFKFFRTMNTILKIIFPFQEHNLRILYLARATSVFGSLLSMLAIPLYVYHKTGSGQVLALTALFETLGSTIASLFFSHVSDGVEPKRFLIILDIIAAILIGILISFFEGNFILLYAIVFGIGFCAALYVTTGSVLISHVERNQQKLCFIEGRFQIMRSILDSGVPALGGFLLIVLSLKNILIIDILSYLGSAFIIGRLTPIKNDKGNVNYEKKKRIKYWFQKQILEVSKYLKNNPIHFFLFIFAFLSAASIGAGNAIFVFHLKSTLGGSDSHLAWLLSLSFGASVISAFLADKIKAKIMSIAVVFFIIMALAHYGLFLVKSVWYFILAYSFADFINTIYAIHSRAYIQSSTELVLVGRVRGFILGASYLGSFSAMLIVSFFADKIPTSFIYLVASYVLWTGFAIGIIGLIKFYFFSHLKLSDVKLKHIT